MKFGSMSITKVGDVGRIAFFDGTKAVLSVNWIDDEVRVV